MWLFRSAGRRIPLACLPSSSNASNFADLPQANTHSTITGEASQASSSGIHCADWPEMRGSGGNQHVHRDGDRNRRSLAQRPRPRCPLPPCFCTRRISVEHQLWMDVAVGKCEPARQHMAVAPYPGSLGDIRFCRAAAAAVRRG